MRRKWKKLSQRLILTWKHCGLRKASLSAIWNLWPSSSIERITRWKFYRISNMSFHKLVKTLLKFKKFYLPSQRGKTAYKKYHHWLSNWNLILIRTKAKSPRCLKRKYLIWGSSPFTVLSAYSNGSSCLSRLHQGLWKQNIFTMDSFTR